jgi:hypothetical protein
MALNCVIICGHKVFPFLSFCLPGLDYVTALNTEPPRPDSWLNNTAFCSDGEIGHVMLHVVI